MSSKISASEIQTMAPQAVTKLKSEEKPYRLVRTSSIEKIKRFNTFICSQQYYLLPALFSWLKSSQPSTESSIFLFKATLFNTFFYKFFQTGLKSAASAGRSKAKLQKSSPVTISRVISNFFQKFTKCFESTFLLAIAVYSACLLVPLQLALALYLMYFAFLPHGFIFMLGCMMAIKYLCYKSFSLCLGNGAKRDIKNK
ncbi:uncharacterized protein LOC108915276 isoform X2 [Anoplophora glabripennis]|nr:uncharacterized protein LOC108915276 isoform X2 [Anoplophora glabripennis]XP_018576794.1 uncharacterized protein LOC108915276 isoform X2 [Anoplophora glabripennis]